MVVFALRDIFVMNEIEEESHTHRKNDEIWEHLPEWMVILKKTNKINRNR